MSLAQELENSIDIVELVSKYSRLKKAGVNYKAVCPFPWHSEKTPSFVVSPVKQLAYCFGCHKGGWPLKFIMDLENCDFREALETLAHITGKKIDTQEAKNYESTKDVYQIFKDITYFYEKSLKENKEIQDYLEKRGLTQKDIQDFHIWYASDGRALYRYLQEKGYSDQVIDESKVFLDIKAAKDKFLGRVIFPIQNLRGDIVAFAWRIIGTWEPKYLNSPTTKVYDKSSILYGLFQAKKEITEKDYVIICEGYMDAIALHRAGFKNTVCVSGTALTEKHIQILKRLTNKFYLCFDNDKAWENATRLSLEVLKNKDTEIHIVNMSWGKDPDELIKEWQDFNEYLQNVLSPIGFYLTKMRIDIQSLDEKKRALKEILEILKEYSNSIEKEFYLKEISKKLQISEQIVYDEFNKLRGKKSTTQITTPTFTSEERIIAFILIDSEFKKVVEHNLLFWEYIGEDLKKILENTDWIQSFELEKKELLRGLSLSIEEENKSLTKEKILENLKWICQKLNFDIGQRQLKEYKKLLWESPNSTEAMMKYNDIARKIKSLGKS